MRTTIIAALVFVVMLSAAAQAPKKKDGKRAESATVQQSAVPSKQLMQQIADTWATLDTGKVERYYDKNAKDLFFDVAPLKYTGWQEYAEGVKKEFGGFQSAKIRLNDDTEVHRSGNMAYGATTLRMDLTGKDGSKQNIVARWTPVWEKHGDKWVIVHDHWSVPLPEKK